MLREWSGLGYNRRARGLQLAARQSARGLPRDVAELDALPGVGAYTASAVACFAYGDATPFADTNVRRVLGRAIMGRTATEREAVDLDRRFMSRREPARWHHALMDIGATICLSRRPRCEGCPLRSVCAYTGADDVVRPRQSPFATSDRRIRGAIVRALRDRPRGVTLPTLRRLVIDTRVPRLLRALAADGLVEVSDHGVRLPAR